MTLASYRSIEKLREAEAHCSGDSTYSPRIDRVVIDMCNVHTISSSLLTYLVENRRDHVVVINNAGVCLEGASKETFTESLQVNCLSPMHLNELLISGLQSGEKLTIVNVSSGEGELVFLNSESQRKINELETYQVRAHPYQLHFSKCFQSFFTFLLNWSMKKLITLKRKLSVH